MNFKRAIRRFISDERGQSTTEYILIMAVVVMVVMKFRKEFQRTIIDGAMTNLTGGLEKASKIDYDN